MFPSANRHRGPELESSPIRLAGLQRKLPVNNGIDFTRDEKDEAKAPNSSQAAH
jgi:hypothetical protein